MTGYLSTSFNEATKHHCTEDRTFTVENELDEIKTIVNIYEKTNAFFWHMKVLDDCKHININTVNLKIKTNTLRERK